MNERAARYGMTGRGLVTRQWIIEAITARDQDGGLGIGALVEETDLSAPAVRHHLQQLLKDGVIARNRDLGAGVRYRLAREPNPMWAVIVDEEGREHGRVEIAEDLRYGPFPGERTLHSLASQIIHTVRGTARDPDTLVCARCGRIGTRDFTPYRRGKVVCARTEPCDRRRRAAENRTT